MNTETHIEGGTRRRLLLQRLVLIAGATAIMLGMMVGAAESAHATTASCSDGRCIVRLSKAETAALGEGHAPPLPAAAPLQLKENPPRR